MSATVRAAAALAGIRLLSRRRGDSTPLRAALVVGSVWFPAAAVGTALAWSGVTALRRRREHRRAVKLAQRDAVTLAELTELGLAAGLDFTRALALAAEPLHQETRAEVERVLRRAGPEGLAASLATAGGRCGRFFRIAARAVDSGAPVRAAIEAFVDDALSQQRAEDLVRIRRLPVTLLFPLALLILPGFMVLTVGPALLGAVQTLGR